MKLFYRELGQGQPLIILHGLFGSSDNWFSLSKIFAKHFKVYVVDQRNHGLSPHDDMHNYDILTEDLNEFIAGHKISQPIIIGHSMGGKVAMNFAVKHPSMLSQLIIVDIIPKAYPMHHDSILKGLKAIQLDQLESRGQADQILSGFESDASVRQFLLKNLARGEDQQFEWRINIPGLEKNMEAMGAAIDPNGKFMGPTLFVIGLKSNYFKPGDEVIIKKYFPSAAIEKLETGHWVQAEKPQEFMKTVFTFLKVSDH